MSLKNPQMVSCHYLFPFRRYARHKIAKVAEIWKFSKFAFFTIFGGAPGQNGQNDPNFVLAYATHQMSLKNPQKVSCFYPLPFRRDARRKIAKVAVEIWKISKFAFWPFLEGPWSKCPKWPKNVFAHYTHQRSLTNLKKVSCQYILPFWMVLEGVLTTGTSDFAGGWQS